MKKVNIKTLEKLIEEEKEKDLIWYNYSKGIIKEFDTIYKNDTMYLVTKLYKHSTEYCYYITSQDRLDRTTDMDGVKRLNVYRIVK
jgi:hypothetical protein